ncbi:MAG: DNA-methyltransferase [Thermoplasmatota archaeon]
MPPASLHAIVTDPPYLLGFLGKDFDKQQGAYLDGARMQAWHERWAHEALRILKPGGHLLAFGGTRTSHRLACALENSGFEIRDTITWAYATGFPKSRNLRKALQPTPDHLAPEAVQWDGYGTALKPATEPIILARKPLDGTVAENVLHHGTGALNVDACRIGTTGGTAKAHPEECKRATASIVDMGHNGGGIQPIDAGRWPANFLLTHTPQCTPTLCISECAVAHLDAQTGIDRTTHNREACQGRRRKATTNPANLGASRFFFVCKPAAWEREAGLQDVPAQRYEQFGFDEVKVVHNTHPTVKPIRLMAYLVRLVTPPGGVVLDPFLGSGSTGIAAILEQHPFIGIEKDEEYARIADARIQHWARFTVPSLSDLVLEPLGPHA